MSTHLAAVLKAAGEPLQVEPRPTPKPGPSEILLEVKAVAVNLVDSFQRKLGVFITSYPYILGSDVSGVVLETGSSVDPALFRPGTRIGGFASSYYYKDAANKVNYGAYQARVLIDSHSCTPLPDSMSFKEAALIGMGALVSQTGWAVLQVPLEKVFKPEDKQAVVIWGAGSGMGTWAVQSARLLGFTVYATASPRHHDNIKTLGATRVFDYKDTNVVEAMIAAGKEDGLIFEKVFQAAGDVTPALKVIEALKPEGVTARVAHAPPLPKDLAVPEDVSVKFVQRDPDETVADKQSQYWFNVWLKEKLANGTLIPTPKVKLLPGGLDGINAALDEVIKQQTSGEKLVLEI